MSADDARTMQRYFEPKFTEYDLIHMHNRHFIIGMTVDGEKSPAFSVITLELPQLTSENSVAIIMNSHEHYGTHRAVVEAEIQKQYVPLRSTQSKVQGNLGRRTATLPDSLPPLRKIANIGGVIFRRAISLDNGSAIQGNDNTETATEPTKPRRKCRWRSKRLNFSSFWTHQYKHAFVEVKDAPYRGGGIAGGDSKLYSTLHGRLVLIGGSARPLLHLASLLIRSEWLD